MHIFPIRFFLFLSLILLIPACNQYRHLHRIQTDPVCIQQLKPNFNHALYKISIDVIGKHISGILVIKLMPDSSTRVVFSNEMGFSFFDFGFGMDTGFHVYQIIPQMNKTGLIKTLRKDFELLLFKNMDYKNSYALTDDNLLYHAFPQTEGINYYITDTLCRRLVGLQRASSKKALVDIFVDSKVKDNPPDSVFIRHHMKINFTISLKKITALAAQ
jgi:hypothetical protein